MRAAGDPPAPNGPVWSAERIAAALPPVLRRQFQREHEAFLALWQAAAQDGPPPAVKAPPTPPRTPAKWGDLMDDWEL